MLMEQSKKRAFIVLSAKVPSTAQVILSPDWLSLLNVVGDQTGDQWAMRDVTTEGV